MDINLENKNAFVCGSSQGIGKACAIELANLGANITLIARNGEKLKAVLTELDTTKGQQHDYLMADFSNPQQLQSLVGAYLKDTDKTIHILINNTGGPKSGPITEAKPDDFLKAINMHIVCNQLLAQAVLPQMKVAQFGRIINIVSTSIKIPIPGLGVSNTTRGAVGTWAKTWANEVAQFGITVNNVLPGFTDTERMTSIIQTRADKAGISYDEMYAQTQQTAPIKRFGKPEEISAVVGFLASPAASYVTGTSIRVDGGRTGSV